MSWEDNYRILEENGWEVECESPFKIRTKDGSFASGEAANIVLSILKYERDSEVDKFEYKCVHLGGVTVSYLNEQGFDGWEVVSIYNGSISAVVYFKRKI